MTAYEVNFDGLVGPTHNYAGLAFGNVASMTHAQLPSNPREAALQGLAKMRLLTQLGIKQAVLPPQERPFLPLLRQLGFCGTDSAVLSQAMQTAPQILIACSSAAAMWTANAATVSPSFDSGDRKVHITPANMVNNFHRSLEHASTAKTLKAIFSDPKHFVHHPALPSTPQFGDEGAANHSRLSSTYASPGVQLFVYGRQAFSKAHLPARFPARQTDAASQALARLHLLSPDRVVFAQQSPEAIDAGVFHNDVISVANLNVFLVHEQAFVDTPQVLQELQQKCAFDLTIIPISSEEVSLQDAVATYLFNSQIVQRPDGAMALIAPVECERHSKVKSCLDRILSASNPIQQVQYMDLKQSMRNGGGPACLRLRVVLSEEELGAINPHVLLTDSLYVQLVDWVKRHFRDRLLPADLADPQLLDESRRAIVEVHTILKLPIHSEI